MSKQLVIQEAKPLVPTTSKELYEIYSPISCMRTLQRFTTVTRAIQSGTPTIGALARSMSDTQIEAYIKLWLIHLNENLDLKKPLNEGQIDNIAFRIVENYRSLNIADVNLLFKNAEMGHYGNTYDRISVTTVLKWFRDYSNERCNTAAELSYQNHVQHKSAFANVARSRETNAREQIAELKKRYDKDMTTAETKKRVKQAQKEFDKQNTKKGTS